MSPRLIASFLLLLLCVKGVAAASPPAAPQVMQPAAIVAPPQPSAMPPAERSRSCIPSSDNATVQVIADTPSDLPINRSRSLTALTAQARKLGLNYNRGASIWGLTQDDVTVDVQTLRFAGALVTSSLCVYPTEAVIRLQSRPTIWVARASPPGSCWDKLVIEREQRHAAIDAAAVLAASERIRQRLSELSSLSRDRGFAAQQAELTQSVSTLAQEEIDSAFQAAQVQHQAIEEKGPIYDIRHRCLR